MMGGTNSGSYPVFLATSSLLFDVHSELNPQTNANTQIKIQIQETE